MYVTGTTLESRTISILGWVVADTIEDMKRRKKFLNSFVNPLQRIDLQYNEYRIEGIPETSIKYGSEMPENNEVMCKFLINLFCPDPMFYTQNGSYVSVANWAPKFKFPLIIPSGNYVTYGDTPQGGTLENPVELTGVSQFTVKNQLYQPKLVRPLRRVDQVKDELQTCFKSKWNKSLQVESSKLKKNNANAYQYYINTDTEDVNRTVEPGCNKFIPSYTPGISAFSGGFNFCMKGVLEVDDLEHAKVWFDEHPTKVFYQSTAYDGTNGLYIQQTTYNVGFVELDGTEDVVFDTYGNTQKRIRVDLDRNAIARYALKLSHGNPGDTPTVTGGISASFNRDMLNRLQIICSPDTWTALGVTDTATAKTWLAAQKAAGTPIQIAYQLATAEVYADDPLKIGGHGIIMGLRSPSAIATITNTGTLPCGFIITFQASGTVENPKIIDINTQEYIRLSHTMQAGEVIRISTLDNNKTVRQIIGEDSINAFNFLDFANSTFLQLAVGINYLRYDADSGLDNLSVEFKFDPRYLEVQE